MARKTLRDVPEFVAAENRMNELARQRAELVEEIATLSEKIRSAPGRSPLRARAVALVDGEPAEDADLEPPRERLQELRRREQLLEEAVKVARDRVEEARRVAARKVIEAERPALVAKVQAIADQLLALNAAIDDYAAEIFALEQANPGIRFHLGPFIDFRTGQPFGNIRIREGNALRGGGYWLREVRDKIGIDVGGEV